MGLFNKIPTDLDLNGPILSITTEPTGATGIGTTVGATGGASVTLTGVATAVVGSSGTGGSGYLSYQWYEEGVGALSNGTYITGTASTGAVGSTSTLTLSNLVTPTDNDREFYLEVDYVPSYTVGVQSVTEAGYKTGNAWNEPLTSGIATVTVTPLIDIVSQPTNAQTLTNSTPNEHLVASTADVTVNANLTDSAFSDDLTYQWFLNGEEVTNEVKTTTTTSGSTASGTVENYYTGPGSHTFPTIGISDLEITVAGAHGGHGGLDGGGPGGPGGDGASGKFFFKDYSDWLGTQIDFYVGQVGNDGTSGGPNAYGMRGNVPNVPGNIGHEAGAGGDGGGAGAQGWSGGGAGGGGNSFVRDSNGTFIIAGAGGGGGGGSHMKTGQNGEAADTWTAITGAVEAKNGQAGQTKNGDGGGGGGGGGGYAQSGNSGAEGGGSGQDQSYGGRGGKSGGSAYDQSRISEIYHSGSQINFPNPANGYINLKYTGYTDDTQTTTRKTTISGSTTSTLRLSCDTVGIQTAQCKISSATASNSPIYTDTVNVVFNSTAESNNINVEGIGIGLTASLSTLNLNNGDFTLQTTQGDVSTGQINNEWVLYSPDKDMDVEMDLYGGKGLSVGDNNGGSGGYSRIRFTMTKNTEYVIAGLTTSINTPFVYRLGTLMACVGKGGDAGESGNGVHGGDGGGVDIVGQSGFGAGAGIVGPTALNFSTSGSFGSLFTSPILYPGDNQAVGNGKGTTISCTKGIYWAQQGVGACDAITSSGKFRLSGGEDVTNTAEITRGYKAGYNIIQTAGRGSGTGGNGGSGSIGGDGGTFGGGGGGSGFQDGSVTVVDTRLGGSIGDGKVVLRLQT